MFSHGRSVSRAWGGLQGLYPTWGGGPNDKLSYFLLIIITYCFVCMYINRSLDVDRGGKCAKFFCKKKFGVFCEARTSSLKFSQDWFTVFYLECLKWYGEVGCTSGKELTRLSRGNPGLGVFSQRGQLSGSRRGSKNTRGEDE